MRRKTLAAAARTFFVTWADLGRGGTPLGGARPHLHSTADTKRDRVVPGIGTECGAEDQARVLAVDADGVLRNLPSGSRKILLLQSEV